MQIRPRSEKNARFTGIPQLAPIAGAIKRILARQERTDSPWHGGGAPGPAAAPLTERHAVQRAIAKRVRFEPLEPRVLMSADAIPVSGTLNTPGQVDHYSFTLTAETHLVFDSLTNNSNVDWTLSGPQGQVVTDRSFSASDGAAFTGTPVLDLTSGTYTLSVSGVGDTTGAYSFRLINADNAQVLQSDTPVSGQLSPGDSTDIYRFSANAGDHLFFDTLSQADSNLSWRLLDPSGQAVFGAGTAFSNQDVASVAKSGVYTLLVEGALTATDPIDYSFKLENVVDTTASLQLDTPVTGSIDQPASKTLYTFSVASHQQLYFDALTSVPGLAWSLTGPNGSLVTSRSLDSSDAGNLTGTAVLDADPGTYTLSVAGAGAAMGGYSFTLKDLQQATALTAGNAVNDTLAAASSTNLYRFSATAGDQFSVDLASLTGGTAHWRLIDPTGRTVYQSDAASSIPTQTLDRTGDYTLALEGDFGQSGSISYGFTLDYRGHVNLPPGNSTTLTLGSQVNGTLTESLTGQAVYRFSLTQDTLVYFDELLGGSNLTWSLTGPRGDVVTQAGWSETSPNVQSLVAGDYALTIGGSAGPGDFAFRLLDLTQAAQPLPLDTDITGTTNPGGAAAVFQFNATAGQKYYFSSPYYSSIFNYRVLDPFGQTLAADNVGNAWYSHDAIQTQYTGTYTVILDGPSYSQPLQYRFTLSHSVDTETSLSLNTPTTGTVAVPSNVAYYDFTLTGEKRLYLDGLTAANGLAWSLTSTGASTSQNQTNGSLSNDTNPVLDLGPGQYRLAISLSGDLGNGQYSTSYGFQLLDVTAAPLLSANTPQSIDLTSSTDATVYRFNASAGDQLGFDFNTGGGSVQMYAFGPDGAQQYLNYTDTGRQLYANGPGTYFLLVKRDRSSPPPTSPSTVDLHLLSQNPPQPLPDGAALTLGSVVSGDFANGGTNWYRFSLSHPTQLYLDALPSSVSLARWIIRDANNNVPAAGWIGQQAGGGGQVFTLGAGDYAMALNEYSGSGAYNFRLLDLATAAAVSVGDAIDGTLDPAQSTNLYHFTAAVGEHVAITVNQLTGDASYPPNVRLIDSAGNEVYGQRGDFGDLAGGDYTLIVEGNDGYPTSDAVQTIDYQVNLQQVIDQTAPLTLDTPVSASITQPGETDTYTFTLSEAQVLAFAASWNSGNLDFSLIGPRGTVSVNPGSELALSAGSYQLVVTSVNGTTTPYQLELFDAAHAAALTAGTPATDTLAQPGDVRFYGFTASSGDQFNLNVSGSAAGNVNWWVFDPYGTLVQSGSSADGAQAIAAQFAGQYTVLIQADSAATGPVDSSINLAFQGNVPVQPLPNGAVLAVGDTATGHLTTVQGEDQYHFTVNQATTLLFDQLSADRGVTWTLDGPGGRIRSNVAFASGSTTLLNVAAGVYTLTIDGDLQSTESYTFRLIDPKQAQTLTLGTNVTLNTSTTPEQSFQFTASAGDRISFNPVSYSSYQLYNWRLIGPDGSVLDTQTNSIYNFTETLTQSGTYYLVAAAFGSGNLTFNVTKVPVTQTALSVGTTYSGNLASGEVDRYTFTVAGPTTLYYNQISGVNPGWQLVGPDGSITSLNLRGSQPFLQLGAAGTYTLIASASPSWNSGTYAFQLLDPSQAPAIANGSTIKNDTLSPSSSARLYQLTGNAGDRFLFDITGFTPYYNSSTWTLYDSAGNQIGNTWYVSGSTGSVQTVALPKSGTYILVVAGGPVTYSFNVAAIAPDTVSTLPLNTEVDGTISSPGQSSVYNFTVNAAKQFYFDTLTSSNNFTWTLIGPTGTVIGPITLGNSDAGNFPYSPVLSLAAGNYSLKISGVGAATGAFRFRLLDLANATPITLGTAVTNQSLTPANSTNIYQFNATAGQHLAFDFTSLQSSAVVYWRLVDPTGRLVFGPSYVGDTTNYNQGVTVGAGTYTLFVEGPAAATSPSTSFGFEVAALPQTNAALTLGTPVSGTVVAGQTDTYTFSVSQETQLYFDSLSNSGALWSLTGPRGTVVSNRAFSASDSGYLGGSPVLDLLPGDYVLTVQAPTNYYTPSVIDTYSFRMLNLSTATAISPGTAVANQTLDPANSTNAYQFSATAGSRFAFQILSETGNASAYWRLVDPYGNLVFGPTSGDVTATTLSYTGTYTLFFEGQPGNTGAPTTFGFNVVPVTDQAAALTLGSRVDATFAAPGQRDTYTFTLNSATQLYFDSLTNDPSYSWTLTGPRGSVSNGTFNSSDANAIPSTSSPLLNVVPGNYVLTITGPALGTGTCSFRLLDAAAAVSVTPGTAVANQTLDPANSTNIYSFSANAGDQFSFNLTALTGSTPIYWRLIAPYGQTVFGPNYADDATNYNVGTQTLTQTGTYLLLVEGPVDNTGTTSFGFNVLPQGHVTLPTLPTGTPLTFGATVGASLTTSGENDVYTFSLTQGTRVYFDSLMYNNSFHWTLTGPHGAVVTERGFGNSDSAYQTGPVAFDLVAGDYALTIDANPGVTGAYSFRMLDLGQATAITPGTSLMGQTLSPASSTNAYRFNVTAGQRFYFDEQITSGTTTFWRLLDPYGQTVFGPQQMSPLEPLELDQTGTYTLLVEGVPYASGTTTYNLNVQPVVDQTAPLTLGATVNDAIAAAGQKNSYNFTISRETVVYLDDLTNGNGLNWSLSSPRGTLVANRGFGGFSGSAVLDLAAGSYVLTVDGQGGATGSYGFNLSSLGASSPLVLGTTSSGTLNPANTSNAYQFTAQAGDRFFVDVTALSGTTPVYLRLVDPYGNEINAQYAYDTTYSFSATATYGGTYTLLVEGQAGATGTTDYGINVQPIHDTTTALTVGAVAQGSLDLPGQRSSFTFSLSQASSLYFDALTNNQDLDWALSTADGAVVASRRFTQDADNWIWGSPLLSLGAGNYVLTVYGGTSATGSFQFRLLDTSQGTTVTPGTVVKGQLSPANTTNVYSFSATAGQQFFFDLTSLSGTTPVQWRLVSRGIL